MNEQSTPSKGNILVVDDTSDTLELLATILSLAGYTVRTAPSGRLALTSIQSILPDLILLDIMMPQMDGYEVCQTLKASPTSKDIPVIFISALNEVFDKVKAFEVGGVDYIPKPFQEQEVVARVENQLRRTRLSKQLQEQNVRLQQEIETRKQTEEVLRQSRQLLGSVLNSSLDGIMAFRTLIDSQRNIVDFVWLLVNPAAEKIIGYTANELVGKDLLEVLPGNRTAGLFDLYVQVVETGVALETELYYEHDSIKGWFQIVAVKLGNGFAATFRDISDRKQAEEALRVSEAREREKAKALELALDELKRTEAQVIQTEKMSSLGRMVAGIAHEINNPVGFIHGNLAHASHYFQDLLSLLEVYQQTYPNPTPAIQQFAKEIDLNFVVQDWQKLMTSMQVGAERIYQIVLSLRNFSRLDEKQLKPVDIHEGIDNTLLILQHRLRRQGNTGEIQVIKDYGQLPKVTCYASQLNQVFLNLLSNAIDALEQDSKFGSTKPGVIPTITIRTSANTKDWELRRDSSATPKSSQFLLPNRQFLVIRIADNGLGMSEQVLCQIFDPFFTTKPVGSGTGLGLSISYQIVVEKHKGHISCVSALGQGTEFIVEIPVGHANAQN